MGTYVEGPFVEYNREEAVDIFKAFVQNSSEIPDGALDGIEVEKDQIENMIETYSKTPCRSFENIKAFFDTVLGEHSVYSIDSIGNCVEREIKENLFLQTPEDMYLVSKLLQTESVRDLLLENKLIDKPNLMYSTTFDDMTFFVEMPTPEKLKSTVESDHCVVILNAKGADQVMDLLENLTPSHGNAEENTKIQHASVYSEEGELKLQDTTFTVPVKSMTIYVKDSNSEMSCCRQAYYKFPDADPCGTAAKVSEKEQVKTWQR